ncbi:hypothetical protein QO058_27120 [Bosea vestrisii]|uniref:hypothetical protein n=1 Tax=Bosea vestrisii TaxID=151416 RepID=UPI0024E03353|nr:hypothetical protein [Bosea vestrisii]WID96354.1 hypothetical protein QO058_27120 [Bosea vestrisii]
MTGGEGAGRRGHEALLEDVQTMPALPAQCCRERYGPGRIEPRSSCRPQLRDLPWHRASQERRLENQRQMEFTMNPELGRRVIAIAQKLVGSHYINGGYGATPGLNDGCPCRSGGISLIADEDNLNPKLNSANKKANLAVNAATMSIKTYCVCAGNYTTFPGDVTTETAADLVAYLDSLKGKPPSSWQNHKEHLTPRRAFGPGQNGGDGGGKLVWGQSCKGIRHFDCVGFISYCYWKASGAVWQLDIGAWRKPGVASRSSISRQGSDHPR